MNIRKLLQLDFLPYSTDAGLLALRLWLGLSLLFLHGWSKLVNFSETAGQFPDPIGLGSSTSLALAVFAEVACALLLVIGAFTRAAAFIQMFLMSVAFFVVHKAALSGPASGELAYIYLGGFVALLITGAGRFSLDAKTEADKATWHHGNEPLFRFLGRKSPLKSAENNATTRIVTHPEIHMPNPTFLHLFSDENGVSRVNPGFRRELAAVEFAPPSPPMFVGHVADAKALVIVELPVGWHGGWHPSPKEQWVICLAGEMGYEAEDGTKFTLRPGTCILTTDTRGRGHDSWNVGQETVRLALVQL